MAATYKAVLDGQFNLVNEATLVNLISEKLTDDFEAITGVAELKFLTRQIVVGDGTVAIPAEGIDAIKGMYLAVSGSGVVTFKHDSNTAGMAIPGGGGIIVFGTFGSPTIQTTSTQALTVKYFFFQ